MAFERTSNVNHAIAELQALQTATVAGAAAATNIAISGITTQDTIESVVEFAAGVPTDRTAEASITSDGNIQLSTTDTTGDVLLVRWYQKPSSAAI